LSLRQRPIAGLRGDCKAAVMIDQREGVDRRGAAGQVRKRPTPEPGPKPPTASRRGRVDRRRIEAARQAPRRRGCPANRPHRGGRARQAAAGRATRREGRETLSTSLAVVATTASAVFHPFLPVCFPPPGSAKSLQNKAFCAFLCGKCFCAKCFSRPMQSATLPPLRSVLILDLL
jgi:hypothetical protein